LQQSLSAKFNRDELIGNFLLQIGNKSGTWGEVEPSPMLVLNPAMLIAVAAIISSLSAFIWSVRRKP
jgi:hypothetical protein